MHTLRLLLLTAMVAAAGPADAQDRDRQGSHSRHGPGPVESLVELRQELRLSDGQVARLNVIDDRMEAQNRPLATRLTEIRRAIRELGPRDDFDDRKRQRHAAYVTNARALMREIQDNNRRAMDEVREILSEEQRKRVSEILRERSERNDRQRDDRDRGRRNDPGRS